MPNEVSDKLNKFEYSRKAHDPDGIGSPELNRHPHIPFFISPDRSAFGSNPMFFFHPSYRAAIGILLPAPNAFVVTFSPGAACRRLYSFPFTLSVTHRTV
jgi:hypothetical protein